MRNNIRNQLTMAFIGLAVLPLLITGSLLIWRCFHIEIQKAVELQRAQADNVSIRAKAYIEGMAKELQAISHTLELLELPRERQIRILSMLLQHREAFKRLILIDKNGKELLILTNDAVKFY